MALTLTLLTVTAIPFWVLMNCTEGFFGVHSSALLDDDPGKVLLLKTFPPGSIFSFSFASILQQPSQESFDVSSRMKIFNQDIPRDVLIYSTALARQCEIKMLDQADIPSSNLIQSHATISLLC